MKRSESTNDLAIMKQHEESHGFDLNSLLSNNLKTGDSLRNRLPPRNLKSSLNTNNQSFTRTPTRVVDVTMEEIKNFNSKNRQSSQNPSMGNESLGMSEHESVKDDNAWAYQTATFKSLAVESETKSEQSDPSTQSNKAPEK